MRYGLMANGINPIKDYGAVVSKRNIAAPTKKNITETVPYMSGFYDFSDICDGPHYQSRAVEYMLSVFDDAPEKVAEKTAKVEAWAYGISNDEFYDDLYPDWHFLASTQSVSVAYKGALAAQITVKMLCHPYRIANAPTRIQIHAGENTVHNGGRPVLAVVDADSAVTLTIGGESQTVQGNAVTELLVPSGTSIIASTGVCTVEWTEEVI